MTTVTLQHFDDCPNWETADRHLAQLAGELGFDLVHERIETQEHAERAQFRGSPTILVDGRDPFATGDEPFGLACRRFETPEGPAGSPTVEQLREAIAGEA